MTHFLARVVPVSAALLLCSARIPGTISPTAVNAKPAAQANAGAPTHSNTLLQQDFNGARIWDGVTAPSTLPTSEVTFGQKPVGTIDAAKTATPSGAMLMTVMRQRQETDGRT